MLPQRKQLPHDVPAWVPNGAIYFITINCAPKGRNHLAREELSSRLWETVDFRCRRGDWWVHVLLLMPDHLHALVSFSRDVGLQETVTEWKRYTARAVGISWQRDFSEHRLRGDESFVEKAHYIRENPVRKGLVAAARDWPYVWPPSA